MVNSVTNCAAWGDASWCTQPASVSITGTEPMPEDQIILIEGARNEEPFACTAATCTVPMLEGSNALTFWAISTYGDSSRMGSLTVLQDTQAPQINAGISGIAGDNGWFVSDAVLSVAYSDAVPGSGISSTSALINGTLTDVSAPVTLPEGVYSIQLDVRDGAGLTAQVIQNAWVDTTAPALSPNQPPPESGIYMNDSVIFSGSSSDATSGVNRIEVAPDGINWQPATLNPDGSWILDWDSSVKPDDTYTPRVAATDTAGNRTEISLQPITLDNSAPAMSLTGSWYIWETGHASVRDTRSGIERIELSVRDEQNRWPATGWQFETDHLEYDINWNRQFEDGTWAPTGSYQVLLQAWDRLGNERYITGRIYIPGAGETPVITSQGMISVGVMEETPQPTLEGTPLVLAAANTVEPAPSKTPASFTFSSVPVVPETGGEENSTSSPLVDPNLLWGASAAAAALAATAYALSRKEEKEEERKRKEEQSLAEANAKVAASEATKTANYIAKFTLGDKLGIPVTSEIVACSPGLKALYQNFVNSILGNPTEEIDEDLLLEIGNDLGKYFNNQPKENEAQTAPASVSWREFVATPVGPVLNDAPTAVDYSNLVSLFNQGEAASNTSYTKYEEYHDKLTRMEELTEDKNVLPQPIITTPLPGITASIPGLDYMGQSLFQPTNVVSKSKPLPKWMGEFALSMIPIVGDGWGVVRQVINLFTTGTIDSLDLILSLTGLVFDLPFDAGFAGDAAIATLKGFSAMIPVGPARDVLLNAIKQVIKNPDEIVDFAETATKLMNNSELLEALVENPKALGAVFDAGPEAVEALAKQGDEAIQMVKGLDEDGVKTLTESWNDATKIDKLWETKVEWTGNPHANTTPGHWETISNKVDELVQSPNVEKVYINKGLSNEVTLDGASNNRPDIMVVKTDGTIDIYEIPSKTDVYQDLVNRSIDNLDTFGDKAGDYYIIGIE